MPRATDSTYERSASPCSVGGVPTATKMAALAPTAAFRSSEKRSRAPRCLCSNSGRKFSWIGTSPRFSAASFFWSLSTTITSWPRSAKHAPATRPTYPEPITAICIRTLPQNVTQENTALKRLLYQLTFSGGNTNEGNRLLASQIGKMSSEDGVPDSFGRSGGIESADIGYREITAPLTPPRSPSLFPLPLLIPHSSWAYIDRPGSFR